jgi:hypothetical protein
VPPPRTPPLRDDEILYLRGMMDEHRRDRTKREALGELWKDSKGVTIVLAASAIFCLQVVELVYQISKGG